jgi:glycosyltransferase involved in cell wall biosynthesis
MEENPKISVLIPAYNEADLISKTIDSVQDSFAAISWQSYEILVCDNNSTDQTANIARAKGVRIIFEPHNQIAKARNTAARHARGNWLIFLDADSSLNCEVLKLTIQQLESRQVCGGGALLKFDGKIGWAGNVMSVIWNWTSPRVGWVGGAFLFCTRNAWVEVNGFDEKLYAAEDVSFSKRLKKWGREKGLKFIVITEAEIMTSSRKLDKHGQWQIILQLILLGLPGALKSRRRTKLWYER